MTVDLAHDIHGSGPLLVLVHGITEDRRTWDPLLPALAADHRVLRVDLRGHGASPKAASYNVDELAADIEPLVDEPPLVVGHSLGGMVATAYAAQFPTRGAIDVDQPLDLAGFQAAVLEQAPLLRSDAFPMVMTAIFDSMRGELDDAEQERVAAIRQPDQSVVLGVWSVLLDSTPEELAGIVSGMVSGLSAPYLSLHGIDPGPSYPEWLGGHVPQAQVVVWPGVGHYPHLVRPQQFLDLLAQFEATLDR